jgi:hypothetical protein
MKISLVIKSSNKLISSPRTWNRPLPLHPIEIVDSSGNLSLEYFVFISDNIQRLWEMN